MATLYTNLAAQQLPVEAAATWSRADGKKVTGDITYLEGIYTVAAGTATGDILRIAKLPANAIVIPHLCKIICGAPGAAFTVSKVGDLSVDGITTPDDDDRYSGSVAITAGGAFDYLHAARPAGLAGYTTPKPMWLIATLGTVTTPTAGAVIRFVVAYAVQS